jgi:hypothetical protein
MDFLPAFSACLIVEASRVAATYRLVIVSQQRSSILIIVYHRPLAYNVFSPRTVLSPLISGSRSYLSLFIDNLRSSLIFQKK